MIFVDTNAFIYAVGRPHPLQKEARRFFIDTAEQATALCTSVEVMQELMHIYLPVKRFSTLDAALKLVRDRINHIWPLETDDVLLARGLADTFPSLGARDLIHMASCQRRGISRLMTFDKALATAFGIRTQNG